MVCYFRDIEIHNQDQALTIIVKSSNLITVSIEITILISFKEENKWFSKWKEYVSCLGTRSRPIATH